MVARFEMTGYRHVQQKVADGGASKSRPGERRYRVDEAERARAVARLSAVEAVWDARLRWIKRIAEAIQRSKEQD